MVGRGSSRGRRPSPAGGRPGARPGRPARRAGTRTPPGRPSRGPRAGPGTAHPRRCRARSSGRRLPGGARPGRPPRRSRDAPRRRRRPARPRAAPCSRAQAPAAPRRGRPGSRRPVGPDEDHGADGWQGVGGVGHHHGRELLALDRVDRRQAHGVEVGVDERRLPGSWSPASAMRRRSPREAAQVRAADRREVLRHAHELAQAGVTAGAVRQAEHRQVVPAGVDGCLDEAGEAAIAQERPQWPPRPPPPAGSRRARARRQQRPGAGPAVVARRPGLPPQLDQVPVADRRVGEASTWIKAASSSGFSTRASRASVSAT